MYGGYADVDIMRSVTTKALNNTVELTETTVIQDVYGGYAKASSWNSDATADASGQTGKYVKLVNTNVTGKVYGGYADASGVAGSATASNITVELNASSAQEVYAGYANAKASAASAAIYGGFIAGQLTDADKFTNNQLIVDVSKRTSTLKVKSIQNFETISLKLTDRNLKNGDVIIQTEKTVLGNGAEKGTTVTIVGKSIKGSELKGGDAVHLITNAEGKLANEGATGTALAGSSFAKQYAYKITHDQTAKNVDAKILATSGEEIDDDNGGGNGNNGGQNNNGNNGNNGGGHRLGINPETKVFSEARVASLAFANGGADMIVDSDVLNQKQADAFGKIKASHTHANTGSSVDVNGVNLVAGVANTWQQGQGITMAGAFFEAG